MSTPTPQDRMEAAAWMAKLHGQDRSPQLEAGFRRWLGESASHRAAFDAANELWEELATIPKSDHPIRVKFKRPPQSILPLPLAASLLLVAGLGAYFWMQRGVYETTVGEHRTFILRDGSEITLNTATRVDVDYTDTQRRLRLDQGEAFFKVAKDVRRPFMVSIGKHEIVALGTSFVARRGVDDVAVTLIDGKIAVSSLSGDPSPVIGSAVSVSAANEPNAVQTGEELILSPGERLTLARGERPRVDRPALERITAWRDGQVNLDHAPLADAITEMNRYSKTQIVLTPGARPIDIQITGIFRAGEPEEFARAVATTYDLRIQEGADTITLSPR